MTSKTTRYSQSITTLLATYHDIQPEAAQALQPEKVFDLIVATELGGAWVREIKNWIEAVGGRIEWGDAEADEQEWEDKVPFTYYTTEINYDYILND